MFNDPRDEDFDEAKSEKKGWVKPRWLVLLAIGVLLLFLWPGLAGFYAELFWFKEVGYEKVFLSVLQTKLVLGVVASLIAAIIIWFNLKLALRLSSAHSKLVRYVTLNNERIALPDIAQFVERWVLPISLILGAFLGSRVWESWEVVLQYRHRTAFGDVDPLFGRDIAFYFFTLPLLELISELLFMVVIICLIGAVVIYSLRAAVGFARSRVLLERVPRKHLLGLLAALFLIVAWRAWLEMPNLLYSIKGAFIGAGYSDVTAALPLLKVQVFAALLAAALAVACMFMDKTRLLWMGLGIYLLVLVSGWVYPSFVQRFSVAPNELVKETPYIKNNIAATRKAFALNRIEEREISGDTKLTPQDMQENAATINNIRLWDHQPLLDTFIQLQEFRPYYEFESVDNDRYLIENKLRQIMISPRELSVDSLSNRNWINERLTFTHGFGLTLGPVNQVTPEGLPVLFIKDIPPISTVPALNITRPEIYFGELSHDPVYVRTKSTEFNYPSGEENVYSTYDGEGGVSIGSLWRRLLFATRFADMKLLLSNDMTPESRVLYHRNLNERLSRIAPFLQFDQDPYLVISEGRLFWIVDAYTMSNRYPYSQSVRGINYIRNSVKAVVDAYHGSVRLYIADESDPLIQTWSKIFPGALKPLSEMPADLKTHLRYPEDIFRIQTAVYSTYHMDQPQIFYNKEDQWEVASAAGPDGKMQSMQPYYTIMKLPGEQGEEFILMLPFTPRSKDNLASWMVGRADGENYGRLLVYRFPKQRLIYGPKQVDARINQDAEISRQLSLWDQRGSKVIRGTLLVIPIKESLIYVQPLYLKADSGKIPELKRVIVVAENRIAMEETLEASLARIFGDAPPPAKTPADQTLAAVPNAPATQPKTDDRGETQGLAAQARGHYDRAIQAQREGDWARYGEEIKRLGAVLEQMSNKN